jgi:uncharacterized protein (TIGR03083 family)
MQPSFLTHDRYVASVRADADRIAELAGAALDAPVPSCPGWTVRAAVEHTAEVFRHKAACIRDRAFPDPWPPPRDPTPTVELFERARDELLGELAGHDPHDPAETWWWDDRTVGFWARRMAHEAAIHRLDVELATGDVSAVDADLAADGIDEVLRRFLTGDWSDDPVPDRAGSVVAVRCGDRTWRVVLEPRAVVASVVRWESPPADATVVGRPEELYRWAWGRGPGDGLAVEGDATLLPVLRDRLARATQ